MVVVSRGEVHLGLLAQRKTVLSVFRYHRGKWRGRSWKARRGLGHGVRECGRCRLWRLRAWCKTTGRVPGRPPVAGRGRVGGYRTRAGEDAGATERVEEPVRGQGNC